MAKTNLKRRNFLKMLAAGTCGSAAHSLMRPKNGFLCFAETPPASGVLGNNPAVIHVNLSGGPSLNMYPIDIPEFADYMQDLFQGPANGAYRIGNTTGYFHPALSVFDQEYQAGNLRIFYNTVIDGMNRSHADDSERFLTAGTMNYGWGAQLASQACTDYALLALSGASEFINANPTLNCPPPFSLASLDQGIAQFGGGATADKHEELRLALQSIAPPGTNEAQTFARTTDLTALETFENLKAQVADQTPGGVTFGNTSFQRACRDVARVLAAPSLQARVFSLALGGFDTHTNEIVRLTQLLTDLNAGIRDLIQALKNLTVPRWNDVVIIIHGEFFRTRSNGPGTDHGRAGPHVVLGGGVDGGIGTAIPNAAYINSNPNFFETGYVDYREILELIIGQGMGYDPGQIIPAGFSKVGISLF